jgi:cob(I)alamin adenosyltransferase
LNKIYTKTGDQGTTQLCDGKRISKDSPRVIACGCIDELNAFIGLALVYSKDSKKLNILQQRLLRIQNELVKINAQLALASLKEIITISSVENLEQELDEMNSALTPLNKFILPGGNKISAHLHVARTVCRRAERVIVQLSKTDTIDNTLIPYLNRLSDWLFVAARSTENI